MKNLEQLTGVVKGYLKLIEKYPKHKDEIIKEMIFVITYDKDIEDEFIKQNIPNT